MKTYRYIIASFLGCIFALAIASCSGNTKAVKALILQADSALNAGDFARASALSLQIDSLAPTDTLLRSEALAIGRKARLGIVAAALDSIEQALPILQNRIDSLARPFAKMKEQEEGATLRMIIPAFAPYRNVESTYIRMMTDTLGSLELASVYAGSRGIKHACVRLEDRKLGKSVATTPIPYDDGLNYRYEVGGRRHEVVTYPLTEAVNLGALMIESASLKNTLHVSYLTATNKTTGISVSLGGRALADCARTAELAEAYRERVAGRSLRTALLEERSYLHVKLGMETRGTDPNDDSDSSQLVYTEAGVIPIGQNV